QTVGCFRHTFPVQLDLREAETCEEALRTVKEALRAVPNHGLDYGLLYYLNKHEQLRALPRAEVNFKYSEQIDFKSTWFRVVKDDSGNDSQPQNGYTLQVHAIAGWQGLEIIWPYDKSRLTRATVQLLVDEFNRALQALINYSDSSAVKVYLPSDFPL